MKSDTIFLHYEDFKMLLLRLGDVLGNIWEWRFWRNQTGKRKMKH
jgi:hypothetical protein